MSIERQKAEKHIKKALTLTSSALLLCSGLTGCGNKTDRLISLIDRANYDEALSFFQAWDLKTDERASLVESLKEKLYATVDEYAANTLEEDYAWGIIDTISYMQLSELDEDVILASSEISALCNSKNAYTAGEEDYANGDYLAAAENFSQVIEADAYYTVAMEQKEKSVQSYTDSVIASATEQANAHEYENAIATIDAAMSNTVVDQTALEACEKRIREEWDEYIRTQAKEAAIEEAENEAKQENYAEALVILNTFVDKYQSDTEVKALYDTYKQEYVSFILEKVENLRESQRYIVALKMLKNAQDVVQSDELAEMQKTIEEEKPIYLCDVKYQNSNRYEEITTGTSLMDTIGNTYSVADGNLFEMSTYKGSWSDPDCGFVDMYLGYKYTAINGVIAVDDASSATSCTISIEGDGVVLYTLTLDRLTTPTSVQVDISNVNVLSIKMSGLEQSDATLYAILSNFTFTK